MPYFFVFGVIVAIDIIFTCLLFILSHFLSPYKITLVVFTQILFGTKSGNSLSNAYKKVKNIFVYMIFRTLK